MARRLIVVDGDEALAAAAAERLTELVTGAVSTHGNACICLTGGRTPKRLYAALADAERPWRARIDWSRLHLFWGDERHVPPDHPDSNYGMANEALIRHVPIPASQVHRIPAELADANTAADEYDRALRDGFVSAGRNSLRFDVMLLGIGEDAHIASIFPGSPLIGEPGSPLRGEPGSPLRGEAPGAGSGSSSSGGGPAARGDARGLAPGRRAEAVWAEHLQAWRITLTPAAILDAERLLILAQGASKADAIAAALEGPDDVSRWPAQLLRAAGDRVEWFIDRPAAAKLRAP